MAYENLCMYCFEDMGGESVCPHCGGDSRAAVPQIQLLPGSYVYHDRFLIGRAVGQDANGIVYAAFDTKKENRLRIREYLPRDCAERLPDGTVAPISGREDSFEKGLEKLRASVENAEDPGKRHFFFEENGTAYIAQRKRKEKAVEEEEEDFGDGGSGKKLWIIIAGAAAVVVIIAVLLIQLLGGALKTSADVVQTPTLNPSASAWAPNETPSPTPYVAPTFAPLVDPEQSWMDYTYKGDVNKEYDALVGATATPVPTVKANTPSYTTISSNSSKTEIQALQQRLAALGWLSASSVNGKYNSSTKQAVKDFQSYVNNTLNPSEKLDVDGVAGPKTLMWLYGTDSVKPTPTPTPLVTPNPSDGTVDKSSSKTDIVAVQRKLIALGLMNSGADDGVFGTTTVAAVKKFQQRVNELQGFNVLSVSGSVDPTTMAYLNYYVSWWENIKKETAAPTPSVTPTIAPTATADTGVNQNSSAKQIKTLQRYLIKVGLLQTGADTGTYDSATLSAVAQFQEWGNKQLGSTVMSVTGIADATTYSYLVNAANGNYVVVTPAPTEIPDQPEDQYGVNENSPKESIQYVQQMLASVGLLSSSDADGIYGKTTQAAVKNFQQFVNNRQGANLLDVNGECNALTLSYLESYASQGILAVTTPEPTAELGKVTNVALQVLNAEEQDGVYQITGVKADFKWSADGEVQSYVIEILDSDGKTVASYADITSTAGNIEMSTLNEGEVYEIRLGALPKNGTNSDIVWTSAHIRTPGATSAPVLKVNGIALSATAVEIDAEQYQFEWSVNGKVSNYTFRLYEADSEKALFEYSGKNLTQGVLTRSQLTDGTTYRVSIGVTDATGVSTWTDFYFIVPVPTVTPAPTETPAPESAPVISVNGQLYSGTPIEVNTQDCVLSWTTTEVGAKFTVRLLDSKGAMVTSADSTRDTTISFGTAYLNVGEIYTVAVGLLDGSDTIWSTAQLLRSSTALVTPTPEPTPEQTPTPEPTATPDPTRPPVSAPILSINGIQSNDAVIELVGDECVVAWSAGGEIKGYEIGVIDEYGNVLFSDTTTDTQRSFATSILTRGVTYQIGVGAIPADGGDTIWTAARFILPALATASPTPAPTTAAVGKPSIQIGSRAINKDDVPYLMDETAIFSWQADGDVRGYRVYLTNAEGAQASISDNTTDTSSTLPIGNLPEGLYQIHVGAIPANATSESDIVWNTLTFGIGSVAPTIAPTETPSPIVTAEPWPVTLSSTSPYNDVLLVQTKLYQLGLIVNTDEIQMGTFDAYTLQAIASFEAYVNEVYDAQLPGVDPTNPDTVIDAQTLALLQKAYLQSGTIVIETTAE